jgi:hypothetical protein
MAGAGRNAGNRQSPDPGSLHIAGSPTGHRLGAVQRGALHRKRSFSEARSPESHFLGLKRAGRQIKVLAAAADIFFKRHFSERNGMMEISPLSTNPAMTAVARQLNTNAAMQTEMLKQMADSQQQMADLLQAIGLGQQVDIQA